MLGLVADVTADTNGLKYAEKNGDSFTFTARKSDGTASGIKDQALKTATGIEPQVKAASGSYGEFLRVDFLEITEILVRTCRLYAGITMEMILHIPNPLLLTEPSLLQITGCIKLWESSLD